MAPMNHTRTLKLFLNLHDKNAGSLFHGMALCFKEVLRHSFIVAGVLVTSAHVWSSCRTNKSLFHLQNFEKHGFNQSSPQDLHLERTDNASFI